MFYDSAYCKLTVRSKHVVYGTDLFKQKYYNLQLSKDDYNQCIVKVIYCRWWLIKIERNKKEHSNSV